MTCGGGLSWRLESLNVSVGHDGVMKVGPDKLQQPHQHQHQPVQCGVKKRDMLSEGYLCTTSGREYLRTPGLLVVGFELDNDMRNEERKSLSSS